MGESAFPTVWLDYRARGIAFALTGNETLGGWPTYVLDLTPKSGPRVRAWIDTGTFMLVRTSVQMVTPQPGEQVTEFADFRAVDGVMVPFSVKSTSGGQTVTAVLTGVKHNVEVDDASFVKP